MVLFKTGWDALLKPWKSPTRGLKLHRARSLGGQKISPRDDNVQSVHNGAVILPIATPSREPAGTSESHLVSSQHVELAHNDHVAVGWDSSCDTTIQGSDVGLLDIGVQKQPRLGPAPNEVDETDVNNEAPIPTTSWPLLEEASPHDMVAAHRQLRALSGTVRKLQNECNAMLETRLDVHQRRSVIRRDRQALGDLDARFMQELRNVLLTCPDERLKSLLDLCEEMQTLRDQLLPKEYDYDLIEDQLIAEEFELQETGEKMLVMLDGLPHSLVGDSELGSQLEEEISQIEGRASRGSAMQRPEVVEYLSRLGDRDMVLERLSALRHERARLVEEEKSRARFNMALDEEAQTFLETFDVGHDSLKKELATVEADLARLSQTVERTDKVLFASTMFEDPGHLAQSRADEVRHPSLNSRPSIISSSDLGSPTATQHPPASRPKRRQTPERDALLLPADDTEPTFDRFRRPDGAPLSSMHRINAWLLDQQGVMSADAFVNNWLLNMLRSSLLEVYQYKSARDLQALQISQEDFRDLVLEWWSSDKAAGEYLRTLRLEARGHSMSPRGERSNCEVQSDTAVIRPNQLPGRLSRHCTLQRVGENVRLAIGSRRSI